MSAVSVAVTMQGAPGVLFPLCERVELMMVFIGCGAFELLQHPQPY